MGIAVVIKAKNLEAGDRVLICGADGKPEWVGVVRVDEGWDTNWIYAHLADAISEYHKNARVVVWRG